MSCVTCLATTNTAVGGQHCTTDSHWRWAAETQSDERPVHPPSGGYGDTVHVQDLKGFCPHPGKLLPTRQTAGQAQAYCTMRSHCIAKLSWLVSPWLGCEICCCSWFSGAGRDPDFKGSWLSSEGEEERIDPEESGLHQEDCPEIW